MNRTVLEVTNLDVKYINEFGLRKIFKTQLYLSLFMIVIFLLSIILLNAEIKKNKYLDSLNKYNRIKDNISLWTSLVTEKTVLERGYGETVKISTPNSESFKCIDYGNYYVPIRINQTSGLPEAIRRGVGDAWSIEKISNNDVSSLQFCNFLINNINSGAETTIKCGEEMFNYLGYSGYFEKGHWCQTALKKISQYSNN